MTPGHAIPCHARPSFAGYADTRLPRLRKTPVTHKLRRARLLEYGRTCPSAMCRRMGTWGRTAVVYI